MSDHPDAPDFLQLEAIMRGKAVTGPLPTIEEIADAMASLRQQRDEARRIALAQKRRDPFDDPLAWTAHKDASADRFYGIKPAKWTERYERFYRHKPDKETE